MLLKKLLLLVCLSSFGVIASLEAQNLNKEDSTKKVAKNNHDNVLFKAIESALKNNKEILAAEEGLKAIHENHVSAAASFRPKINFNTQYQAGDKKTWITKKDNWDNNKQNSKSYVKSYGVGVKQNIFHGFADVAALKEIDWSVKAKWSEFEAKKQEVLKNVAIAYFTIIAKKEEINHLKSLLDARKESIEVAKETNEAGSAKYLDVAQANAAYAETESKLAKVEAEYIAYVAQFEEMTGYKLPNNLIIPGVLFDEKMTEQQAIDIALKNNPTIAASVYALSAAKIAVKKATPEFTPSVDLSYSFDQSYDHSSKNRAPSDNKLNSKGHTVALALSVPIYDGGAARAEKRKFITLATKAAVEKEKTIDDVKAQIKSVLAALNAAKQSLISAREAIKAREIALRDTKAECKAGVKIIKDELDAQEQLFEAKFMETQAENDYFSNQCRANALLGRMDARYLKVMDAGFNYKEHFRKTSRKL